MSQMYGNVVQPEETNENVYEEYIHPTGSFGPTRQDDACKKNSERKNRKIISYNIAITTALILTFGLAACGMFFAVQNNNRIQKLMEELEVKIENLTTRVMHNHEELEMKMVTMGDRMRNIDTDSKLIRINHEDISSLKEMVSSLNVYIHATKHQIDRLVTVRLMGNNSYRSGRVEVFHTGEWGTICDDEWGKEESNVVCHMLGFGNASIYLGEAYFGEGKGKIWLDDVQCTGNESDITYCRHEGWGNHDCDHYEDISVACDSVSES